MIRRIGPALLLLVALAPGAGAGDFWKPFIAGATSGFVIHEGSHLILDLAFDTEPRLTGVPGVKSGDPASRGRVAPLYGWARQGKCDPAGMMRAEPRGVRGFGREGEVDVGVV